MTSFDGYPMAQQGRAGVALFSAAIASFFGGMVGVIILAAFAPALARVALSFGSPEYIALITVGLLAAALVGDGSPSRSLAAVIFGLILGIVGTDVGTGVQRYTFGVLLLGDGINLVVVTVGLFGIAEVLSNVGRTRPSGDMLGQVIWRSLLPERDDWRRSVFPQYAAQPSGRRLVFYPEPVRHFRPLWPMP